MSVMWQIFRYVLIFGFIYSVQKTIFNLIEMYENPKCGETADFQDKLCLESILNNKPNLDLFVYVSDKSTKGKYDLILERKKFDYLSDFEKDIDIELPRKTRNNGSLFIYTVFALSRPRIHDRVPLDVLLQEQDCVHTQNKLTKYMVPVENAFNLLNSNKAETGKVPITHLRSKYTIDMCTDHLDIPHRKLPEELYSYIRLSSENKMLPIFFQNVMHSRLKDLVPIKPDDKVVTLKFIYHPQSLGMMRFNAQLKVTLLRFLEMGFTEKELDEVKGVFVDTNLYLLCATICIGSIHLLLDVLTFKNDISFWRSHSSMAGLSTRTVLWRAFSQTVIFLFLLDEGTSLLILVPSGISTLIEFWKVNKVLKPFQKSWFGGKAKKIEVTKEEEETKKYDDECMRYLSYVLYPLLIGAAVYSLMFQPHKSWYSWTINSLVNGVYAFGFLFMLPQLFINYRLKSVAALPWRAFTYKAFNTFIDDIFAFIITMPTAHRVACFRDDVVFIIYLYQRWLYPVDTTRKDVDPEVLATSSKTEIKEKTKED